MSLFCMAFLFSNSNIGQFSGSVYMGLPNVLEGGITVDDDYIFEVLYVEGESINIDYSTVGPIGILAIWRPESDFSFGLDVNYSSCKANFNYRNTILGSDYPHTMDVNRTILRAMLRIDKYWGDSETFEAFTGIGLGNRSASNTFESTRPDFEQTEGDTNPLAFRLHAGANIYVVDNLGILIEGGIGGGGLARFGITYKM